MQQNIDISKLSITELKSLCYDRVLILERTQAELQLLNKQIKHMEETPIVPIEEVVETAVEVAPEVTEPTPTEVVTEASPTIAVTPTVEAQVDEVTEVTEPTPEPEVVENPEVTE